MDIDKLRQAAIDVAKQSHPSALNYRTQVGIGDDYVEALYEIHDGSLMWMNTGIYLEDVENKLKEVCE